MSLNIKNPETHRLVRQLAQATGLSQTAAVEDAVRRRLDEISDPAAEQEDRRSRAQKIAQAYSRDLTPEDRARIRAADADLYDELGLPS